MNKQLFLIRFMLIVMITLSFINNFQFIALIFMFVLALTIKNIRNWLYTPDEF